MPSANHLSTITTFSDWGHADRIEIDEAEASTAWAAIHKAHLEDPQQRYPRGVASIAAPRGWYGPHVSQYPPPPPLPPSFPISNSLKSHNESLSHQGHSRRSSNYVTPYIKASTNSTDCSDHYARRQSLNDELDEEFPSRNDPLTPHKMGGDVPYPYHSAGPVSLGGFEIRMESLLDSLWSEGEYAPYPPSASSSSTMGNQSLKMSRRSGLVLSAVNAPAVESKIDGVQNHKYKKDDLVEVFMVTHKVNHRDVSQWIMGMVNSSDILPGWTADGERIYDIRYRIKYCHPLNPTTETWGIFSDIEVRRLVPRLSNTPWPENGTLLFVRSKILDSVEGKPRSTWFPSICYDYGVVGLAGEYSNAMVPSDSRFRPCTKNALEEMRRDGSKILFPWSNFEHFLDSVKRHSFEPITDRSLPTYV